ncbi:hypothetical protein Tco_0137742 [Tanacetum coccineum]
MSGRRYSAYNCMILAVRYTVGISITDQSYSNLSYEQHTHSDIYLDLVIIFYKCGVRRWRGSVHVIVNLHRDVDDSIWWGTHGRQSYDRQDVILINYKITVLLENTRVDFGITLEYICYMRHISIAVKSILYSLSSQASALFMAVELRYGSIHLCYRCESYRLEIDLSIPINLKSLKQFSGEKRLVTRSEKT